MFKNKFTTVSRVLGMLLILEAVFMIISFGVAIIYGGNDIYPLLYSAFITLAVGLILRVHIFKRQKINIDRRLGFLIVALIWLIMSLFGSLPYYIGGYLSYTDAFFETMSGFTTTGASVISDVEILPKGILFWRALTNGIGGIGIIVIVISFIPFIGGGGMAMFSAETTGPSKGKLSPNIKKTSSILLSIYIGLISLSTIWLWVGGMSFYDAICHSLAALASGGFSTKNLSAAAFSPLIQYLLILSMIPSGINFTILYYFLKGRFKKAWKSEELKMYFVTIFVATILITAILYNSSTISIEESFRVSLFQVTSFLTSTGMVNTDFSLWLTPAIFILYLLMFSGAMSGSTTGGLKLVRVILLFKMAKNIIKQSIHSRGFIPVMYDKKVVEQNVLNNVLSMFLLFITTYIVGSLALTGLGVGLFEALGSGISFISNIGPGFGKYGGFNNFASFPTLAKWVGSIMMYLGRLELITVFVLFVPAFWKR